MSYSFLEKYICRRITCLRVASLNTNEIRYSITFLIPNISEIYNRKYLLEDDMICMEITENDSDNSLHYEVSRFRFKRIEDINNKKLPTIYHKGGLNDYDWDVASYSYKI